MMGLFAGLSYLRLKSTGDYCSRFGAHLYRQAPGSEVSYEVYSKQRNV